MGDKSDLSDSIARLQALRERIRKAEEAAAQAEQTRKANEEASTKLLFENTSIKQEVSKERKALQEFHDRVSQLDSQRDQLQSQLQSMQQRITELSNINADTVVDDEDDTAKARQKVEELKRRIKGIDSQMEGLNQ